MASNERTNESLKDRWARWSRPIGVPDDLVARLGAWVLWSVVLLAGAGGVAGWLRPAPAPVVAPSTGSEEVVGEAWGVAGFGERYVAAWLSAGPDTVDELAAFLGYTPDLSFMTEAAADDLVGAVRAVEVEEIVDGYWAVTVAAGGADEPGGERFWRVGVAAEGDGLVATGLPSPVAGPADAERASLDVMMSAPPTGDDPLVETVAGFVAAHSCGDGPLDRWLAPGAAVAAVQPPVCDDAELDRWGVSEVDDGRQVVVAEAVLDRHERPRRVTYAVVLAERDGRWEVAALLPGAPTADQSVEVPS